MMAAQEVRRRKNARYANNDASAAATSTIKLDDKKKEELTVSTSSSKTETPPKYDEYAWFGVFLLALCYFILTRSGAGNRNGLLSKFSKPYEVVASSITIGGASNSADLQKNEELLRSIFYVQKGKESSNELGLSHKLEVVISSPPDFNNTSNACPSDSCLNPETEAPFLSHLTSTTWVHDAELGRGYLLLADAGRSGRIWRWEVGGGPITIGRSLHMERSGCRSGLWVEGGQCPENLFSVMQEHSEEQNLPSDSSAPPLLGTASIIVELQRDAERSTEGKNLIVTEWGERRIVRVEGETGARTPLVANVPASTETDEMRRVFRPNHLMYTPFGDLLFSDSYESVSSEKKQVAAVYRLKEAVHVPPIPVEQSREAHSWTHTISVDQDDSSVDVLFETEGWIDGMTLGDSDHSVLFVSVVSETGSGWTKTVYKLSLTSDDDEDDDDNTQQYSSEAATTHQVVYSIALTDCQAAGIINNGASRQFAGSKIAIDDSGTIYLSTCPSTLALISSDDGHIIGNLPLNQMEQTPSISSVNFGEDGYIYLTSSDRLMRVKSRVKGRSIPTNMVVPPSFQTARRDKRDKQ